MFVLIWFFFFGDWSAWSRRFRHYCFILIDSIATYSATSYEIKKEVNEQDEAKEEKIKIVALDVLWSILEYEVIREKSSLSESKDDSFHDWIPEVFLPDVDQWV